jgi:hypothetical protein
MPLNVLLGSPAQQPLYTLIGKHQSLFRTAAGVLPLFLSYFSFLLHPVPYSISSFLNVTILH